MRLAGAAVGGSTYYVDRSVARLLRSFDRSVESSHGRRRTQRFLCTVRGGARWDREGEELGSD